MSKPEIVEKKSVIEKLIDDNQNTMVNLFTRYLSEGKYEPFKEYEEVFRKIFPGIFDQGTKRPFGCKLNIDGLPFDIQVFVTNNTYGWRSISK